MISIQDRAYLVLRQSEICPQHHTALTIDTMDEVSTLLDRSRRLLEWWRGALAVLVIVIFWSLARVVPWLFRPDPVSWDITLGFVLTIVLVMVVVLLGFTRSRVDSMLALEVDLLQKTLDVENIPRQILEEHPHLGPAKTRAPETPHG